MVVVTVMAQHHKTENLIIVTLDGMRWQEVYKGVDAVLMNDSSFNKDQEGIKAKFWAEDLTERRKNCSLSYGQRWQRKDSYMATVSLIIR